MKTLKLTSYNDVYNAPTIPWNSDTYTPVSNKFIMDFIEDNVNKAGLVVKNNEFKTAVTDKGLVKGVIGSYNITADNNNYGQRIMFRNSYDKSMSFAFVCGTVVWICTNGCISGDYQYKRVHRGVITNEGSTTIDDIVENITGGFGMMQVAFENNVKQLEELKHFEISPNESYNILGELFFKQEVINITQMSIIKKELEYSRNFRHLGDKDFTAYDLYNNITESLKKSHVSVYIKNHIQVHKLFEETFNI